MKKYLVGVLLLACTLSVFAQSQQLITLSGRVIEEETKEPVELAAVQLLSLPDSAQVAGITTQKQGYFTLPKVKAGSYLLKVSFIGFQSKILPLKLAENAPTRNVGTLALSADAVMLGEAVVTAQALQVAVVEDTLVYSASAYRMPEGAMLEELVKKIPGAEVDEDGNVKINGKEVKKIMVDGKEFFGGDVKTGLKNLPVNMIDRLKSYDKKSDLTRITGIDDGEEETVLDLKVKKGMNKGWFGNADVAAGSEERYSANLMLNRFVDQAQLSIIGAGNNVNDQGFSGGGGGPRWRRSNGLNTTKTVGVNFATETPKLETGGSARYNYRGSDMTSTNASERFLTTGNSYSNSNSNSNSKAIDFNADYRLEWKPDSMTNVLFRPNLSYGNTESRSGSYSATFNQDPYGLLVNPNSYLDFANLENEDPLQAIRVNGSNNNALANGNSLSVDASLQYNRKLNSRGRNITFKGTFGYGDRESDQYTQSETRYYRQIASAKDTVLRNQYITTPTDNYTYRGRVTYSEPIAKATFLQFSYDFQYKLSNSHKQTYDLLYAPQWELGLPLPSDYATHEVDSLGKKVQYKYFNHDITTSLRLIREKYNLTVGASLQPQSSKLSYKRGNSAIDTVRNVVNFAPSIDFRYRFSKVSQLRLSYDGDANQPDMESLLPITDNSNPLNIRQGNPGLKPSFSHSMRLFYNTFDADKQRGIMTHARINMTQNGISSSTEYVEETGGIITRPENIDGNWSASAVVGYNTALKNKKYTINTFSRVNYQNNVDFLFNQTSKVNDKNTSTALTLSERVSGSYRNDWFEFTLNGSLGYVFERNKLRPDRNQQPYDYSFGATTNITLPWSMTLATNISNNSRRGYIDASMNRDELIWNAQLAQSFLKGSATVTFELYDILRQQTNVSRSLTASMRSVTEYVGINSYFMLHFIYRLNIFGSKAAREGMDRGMGGPGDSRGSRPGGGMMRGERPRF